MRSTNIEEFLPCYKATVRFAIAIFSVSSYDQNDRKLAKKLFSSNEFDQFVRRLQSQKRRKAACFLSRLMQFKKLLPALPAVMKEEALRKHKETLSAPVGATLDLEGLRACSLSLLRGLPIIDFNTVRSCIRRSALSDKAAYYNTSGSTFQKPNKWFKSLGYRRPETFHTIYREELELKAVKNVLANMIDYPHVDTIYCENRGQLAVKAIAVPDKGKFRVITKEHGESKCLQVVQQSLHDYLRVKPEFVLIGRPVRSQDVEWLRSDPDASNEAVFISGDYESATDYISLEATEAVALALLPRVLPTPLCNAILAAVSRKTIIYPDGSEILQKRGQLMGGLLSFPFLCIINYAAFRSVFPNRRVLINGDDILFKATPQEFDTWRLAVESYSLVLNQQKTIVHRHLANINSTSFWCDQSGTTPIEVTPYSALTSWDPKAISGLETHTQLLTKKFFPFGLNRRDTRPLFGLAEHGGLGAIPTFGLSQRRLNRLKRFNLMMHTDLSMLQDKPLSSDLNALSYVNDINLVDRPVTRERYALKKSLRGAFVDTRSKLHFKSWSRLSSTGSVGIPVAGSCSSGEARRVVNAKH